MNTRSITRLLQRSMPLLLSAATVAAAVMSTVLSAKAGIKANEAISAKENELERELTASEKVKLTWKYYILPGSVAAAAAAGSIGQFVTSKRALASAAMAYGGIKHSYDRYVEQNKSVNGEDAHLKALLGKDAGVAAKVRVFTDEFGGTNTLDFDADEDMRTFYDAFSCTYFESTMNQVMAAQQLLNRELVKEGEVSSVYWYECLGIEPPEEYQHYVWTLEDDLCWIDFNNTKVTLDDGFECCVIEFAIQPYPDPEYTYF